MLRDQVIVPPLNIAIGSLMFRSNNPVGVNFAVVHELKSVCAIGCYTFYLVEHERSGVVLSELGATISKLGVPLAGTWERKTSDPEFDKFIALVDFTYWPPSAITNQVSTGTFLKTLMFFAVSGEPLSAEKFNAKCLYGC